MAQKETLLTIDIHTDDETGMYATSEITCGLLYSYLKEHGAAGMQEILAIVDYLAQEMKKEYQSIKADHD